MVKVDGFRYSFVMSFGLLIIYRFEGKVSPEDLYSQKHPKLQMLMGGCQTLHQPLRKRRVRQRRSGVKEGGRPLLDPWVIDIYRLVGSVESLESLVFV